MNKSMSARARIGRLVIFLVGLVLSLAYVSPFALVLVNSFKTKYEIVDNPLSWPVEFTWDNFTQAIEKMKFLMSLTNSVIITVLSVAALIIFSSMLAYLLQRNKNKFTKITFLILVSSMIVLFQALMIPFMAQFAPFVEISN